MLAGTIVHEIMEIGMWKTDKVVNYRIGSTICTRVQQSKKKRDRDYATVSELPRSPAVESVSPRARRSRRKYTSTS